jgi:hypothetical protein
VRAAPTGLSQNQTLPSSTSGGEQPFAAKTMNVSNREIEQNLCFSNFHDFEVASGSR